MADMRSQFREWYLPTEDEIEGLWTSGLVALDAGALLSLYRMNEISAGQVLDLYDWLGNRLFVPHRAAFEYHKNRLNVVRSQAEAYEKLRNSLKKSEETLTNDVNRHGVLRSARFLSEVALKMTELRGILDDLETQHPWPGRGNLTDEDGIQTKLITLLDGKIGKPLTLTDQLRTDAVKRLDAKIPPGYMDRTKGDSGDRAIGDLIVWWEILEEIRSGSAAAGVLIVTEDLKEDWWWKEDNERVGPRPELSREAMDAGAPFLWMQSLSAFVVSGARHLGWPAEGVTTEIADPGEALRSDEIQEKFDDSESNTPTQG
jgi:hypothetical protein